MCKKSLLMMLLLALLVPWAAKAQTTVTIGEGTATCNTNPIGTYYNYSITEQLYTAEEIGTAGTISSISFYYMGIAAKDLPITVYMANVDAENLSSGISLADADEVFSGTLPVTTTAGWVTINLDTPFAYDGTSNLLIGFIKDYLYYFSGQSWQGTATTATMARYTQSDSAGPYTTGTVPGTAQSNRPNIQIVITAGGGGTVCEKPTTVTAFDITPNSAWLSWEGGSTPGAGYNVELKGGNYADWTRIYSNVSQGCILTNLTPGTSYSARVQVNCSDTEASGWKSVNFLTPFALPLVEGFGTSIPTGWSMYTGLLSDVLSGGDLSTVTYGWVFGSNNGVFDNHARVNIYGTSCKYWLVTPSLVMEDNVQLLFDLAYTAYSGTGAPAQTGTDDKFTVLINNGSEWTVLRQWDNAGSEYVLNDLNTTPITVAIDLSSYAGQNIAVAFYGESTTSNADNNLHIDNVSINYIPDCAIPTSLAKANVTAHTVDLSWTSEASAWVVAYKPTNEEDFREVNVTENPYTLTGLTPETAYTVKVKANCGDDGYSEWTGELTFTTTVACPVPTDFAVSNVTNKGATLNWTNDAGEWVVAYKAAADTVFTEITVTEKPYTFNTLASETQYTVKVKAVCGGEDGESQYTTTRTFTTLEACPAPTSLAASNITTTSATLSWFETGDATAWVVAYKVSTDTVFTEVPVTENPYTLNGLTPETEYTAKVRPSCNEEAWSSTITFEPTAKLVIGSGTATSSYVPVTTCYNYSLSQQIYTAAELGEAGAILSIDFYSTNGATKARNFDIYMVSTDKSSFESTTDWIAITANDLVYSATNYTWQVGWNTFELDNPFIYDGTSNVAIIVDDEMVVNYECSVNFRVFNATSQAIYVRQDDANYDPFNTSSYTATGVLNLKNQIRVLIGEPPACAKPTGLAVNYEGGTEATVTWTGEAETYNIEVNGIVTEGVTSPYTLTNLELATEYKVKVQADCGGNGVSEWAGPVSFTTDFCMPENMCAITIELTDAYGDGGGQIQVVDKLTEEVLGTYTNSGASATYTLAVCDGRILNFIYTSTDSWSYENGWVITDINGEVITEHEGCTDSSNCTAPTNGVIADYVMSCTISTCRRPTNLAVTEVGPHSAMLSWTENGEATEWVVEITDVLGGQITEWNASANPYTIVGLEPETDYSVRVRPVCSDFDDKWSTAITFTTDIACPKPYDLTITPYPFTANVEWSGFGESYTIEWVEAPATRDGLWLQYDNGTHYTNIGGTTEGYRNWGVRYPAEMLEGNNTLTKVAVMESSYYVDTIPYTINIYSGDTPETGTLVGTETVNPTGTQGMREITLSTPATINPGQSLWITLTAYGTYMMPACTVNNPDNQWWDNNADGIWTIMGEDNTNLANYGWMIRGYVEGYDASAWNWNSETGVTSPYTIEGLEAETTYAVKVQANCGNDGESGWIWAYFTTPSACDAPVELEATDITYNAATLNWVGYQDSYNVQYREATKYVTVWEDGFENGISDEWTIVAGEGATHPDAGIWYTINPTDGLAFEAHGGDYCASSWSWNSSEYQADNWLITPQLDLQGVLKYYVRTNASYPDSYEVLLSTTDAETTSFTVTLKEMAAAPGNGEWNEVIIDLSAYNEQTGYIAIHHVDYDMNYLCIDDFGIYSVVEATAWIPATTTEPTLAITGLTHDTDYEWQVQGINAGCDGGLTEWSEIASFTAAPLPTQTIALNEGWNWVSFDVEITLNDLKAVLLEAVPGTAITIRSKTQTHSYNPSNGRWSGRLTWDLSQMYRISVTTDCEVAVQGFPVDPAEHPANVLGNGQFNWIAFPLSESMSLTNAFAGFAVNGDLIRSKNGNSQYNRGRWQGSTLTTLQPGQGYIYKSSTSAATRTLTFPGGNRQTVAPETVQPQPKLSVNPTMVKMPRTIDLFPTKK